MSSLRTVFALLTSALTLVAAQEAKPSSPPAAPDTKSADKEAPLPPDAHVAQTIQLEGKALRYTATVGTLPVFDKDGKKSGEVVYTSYIMEGDDRPVTFALNGGPGAASVYLNLGAIGPKRVRFGDEGDSPSDPATLTGQSGHLAGLHRPRVSSTRSAPASAARWFPPTKPRSSSTPPRTTSITSRGSSTTGW